MLFSFFGCFKFWRHCFCVAALPSVLDLPHIALWCERRKQSISSAPCFSDVTISGLFLTILQHGRTLCQFVKDSMPSFLCLAPFLVFFRCPWSCDAPARNTSTFRASPSAECWPACAHVAREEDCWRAVVLLQSADGTVDLAKAGQLWECDDAPRSNRRAGGNSPGSSWSAAAGSARVRGNRFEVSLFQSALPLLD